MPDTPQQKPAKTESFVGNVMKYSVATYLGFLISGAALIIKGILPADTTVDGVHFTKAWYQKWLAYLMEHTVDAEVYQAGVAAAEGVSTS